MKPLPKSVRVGYCDYAIEAVNGAWMHSNRRVGEFDYSMCAIRVGVVPDQRPEETVNTLIHELLHACYRAQAIEGEDGEERTVTALANALTQVWRDNPALVRWIDETLTAANDNEREPIPAA